MALSAVMEKAKTAIRKTAIGGTCCDDLVETPDDQRWG